MNDTRIVREDYHGWPNTYRLSNGLIEARVVTDIGPRIIDIRLASGSNLMWQRQSELGGSGEGTWIARGGWRLWTAPERRETTYALDNVPCTVEIVEPATVRVTAPLQPAAGVQKFVEVSLPLNEPRLRITSRMKNITDQPLTYAAWSLPALRPGGRAFVPMDVGPLTAFDSVRRLMLWSYTEITDRRYQIGDRLVQVDHRLVGPSGGGRAGRGDDESKIGVDSGQGWAAYLLDATLFLKRFPHDPRGLYPDGGATIEVYSNHEFLELEHLGPLSIVAPGAAAVMREDWWLFGDVSVPADYEPALDALRAFIERAPTP